MFPRLSSLWKRIVIPDWTAPPALLLAALLCYGLRLRQLGFYWDDWPYLYLYKLGGWNALYTSLGVDRPLLSGLYLATLSLLGNSPLAWQVFGLGMRWLLGWAFYFALRQAWPGERPGPLAAALLFTVYPGFTQQWISVVWGNAYVLYAAVFLSLGLSAWAARRGTARAFWAALAAGLPLSAFAMFSTEYFFGLELLRPALVWLALSGAGLSRGRRIRRALAAWLPYLGLMAAFIVWRTTAQSSAHGGLYLFRDLQRAPLQTLFELAGRIGQDLALAVAGAWGQALAYAPLIQQVGVEIVIFALGVGALFGLYLSRGERTPRRSWALESALLGIFAMLAAGWPVWVSNLPLHMGFPWDRYTLSLSAGAALLTAGLIDWLGRSPAARALLLAVLIGAAAGFHNANALLYRKAWIETRELFWQLSWRAPLLEPGTALLTDGAGLSFNEDDSLTAPLNWMYAGESDPSRMNTIFMNLPERFRSLNYLQAGSEIRKGFPAASFAGSSDQAVVLLIDPRGCLQALDPKRDRLRGDLPDYARQALPLSRLELLGGAPELPASAAAIPAAVPAGLFGAEPEHKWCYYYETAALAAQQGDWQRVNELRLEAFERGYKPLQASEYLVFVEAGMRTYTWYDARELSRAARTFSYAVEPALCQLWKDAAAWGSGSEAYRAISPEFSCTE